MSNNGGNGRPPFEMMQAMFEPRPYKNISELLGIMGNILMAGERSDDPAFKERYIKLFDVMYKGLAMYIDKEFYVTGPNVPVELAFDNTNPPSV